MEQLLGVHVAAGWIYFGVVRCPDEPMLKDPADRMAVAEHLDTARGLRDLANRVREQLRRVRPLAVGVVQPRRHGNWTYRNAAKRIHLVAAVMMAAAEEDVDTHDVTQETIARTTGTSLDPKQTFPTRLAKSRGIDPVTYWPDRAYAFGAAWALAPDKCA